MANPITPIRAPLEIVRPQTPLAAKPPGGFGEVFLQAMDRVEQFHRDAGRQVERLLSGESDDLHGTILATQKADLAFELFAQVRNKVVQAYQEVMRMQL